jgi:CRISPR/Cas system-associated exonuclease Cas4 (RecB family)
MSFFKPMITAWSYSRLSAWEACPAKAKYKFLDKLPEESSAAASRGLSIHKMAEQWLKGELDSLPVELTLIEPHLAELVGGLPELQLAFDKQWEETEWFAKNAYCRVVFDVVKLEDDVGIVVDHKTGKQRHDEHTDQLRLYALAAFKKWPQLEMVHAKILYIDDGGTMSMKFRKDKVPSLQAYWDNRAGKMLADDIFSPKPNPGCRWCSFSKAKGGPCLFS